MNYIHLLGAFILLTTVSAVAIVFCNLFNWQKIALLIIEVTIITFIFDVVKEISDDHLDAESAERKYAKELHILRQKRDELEVKVLVLGWNPKTGERQYIFSLTTGTPEKIIELARKSQ